MKDVFVGIYVHMSELAYMCVYVYVGVYCVCVSMYIYTNDL